MTTVYFVQHGIAVSKDIDETRPLSESGAEAVKKMAQHLKSHSIEIDSIHHSGKLRAQQTARLFCEILNISDISAISGMNPNDDPALLIAQLENKNQSMYVGHLPNIEKVVSRLLTQDRDQPVLSFRNSAVACVDIGDDGAKLSWFITPELC